MKKILEFMNKHEKFVGPVLLAASMMLGGTTAAFLAKVLR